MTSKYDKIRNEAMKALIGDLTDIARECPDKDTSDKLINALAEYNEKRWAASESVVEWAKDRIGGGV